MTDRIFVWGRNWDEARDGSGGAGRGRTVPGKFVRCALSVLVLNLVGCASPPDISSFARATHELSTVISSAGKEIHSELEVASLSDQAARFQSAWHARDEAMLAASNYADSLVSLVASANSSGDSARTLAQSLQSFAKIVGVVNAGASNTTQFTTDTAAFIYAQIALVRASRALDEAVAQADPVVRRLAEIMVADTHDLESIVRAAAAIRRLDQIREFDEPLAFRQTLRVRQSELREKPYKSLTSDETAELDRLSDLLAPVEAELTTYNQTVAALDRAETLQIELIAQTREAITSWANAHSALALALAERRPFNADSLVNATLELRDLVRLLKAIS